MQIMSKNTLILITLFVFFTIAPAFSAARFSGKILSFNPQSRIYTIELKDGNKVKIKLREDGKSLRSQGSESFKVGERAVFSIVSPLNDDPLIADSIMDAGYAKTTNSTAYTMPRNTVVGSFPTVGGPVVTAGRKPNVIGGLAHGGSPGADPGNIVNAPFTSSPSALSTPVTGEIITNPDAALPPQSSFTQGALSPLNTQGESGFYNQPGQISNQQQPLNLVVGNSPQGAMNPNALVTGNQYQSNPQNLIYGEGAFGKNGGNATSDPSMMFGANDDEDDEEDDPFAAISGQQNVAGAPVQITVKLMSIDVNKGILFYMLPGAPGMQELGTAVITTQTRINDGRTGQSIGIQNLVNGSTVNISGVRRDNSSITATAVTVMQ